MWVTSNNPDVSLLPAAKKLVIVRCKPQTAEFRVKEGFTVPQ